MSWRSFLVQSFWLNNLKDKSNKWNYFKTRQSVQISHERCFVHHCRCFLSLKEVENEHVSMLISLLIDRIKEMKIIVIVALLTAVISAHRPKRRSVSWLVFPLSKYSKFSEKLIFSIPWLFVKFCSVLNWWYIFRSTPFNYFFNLYLLTFFLLSTRRRRFYW